MIRAGIHWNGGEVTTLELPRGQSGVHHDMTVTELIELLRDLATELSAVVGERVFGTPSDGDLSR